MRPIPSRSTKVRGPKVGRPKGRFTQHRRLDRLREVLESEPRGLTLEDLAATLKITQRSVRRYLRELDGALHDLGEVRESLRGADGRGEPFRFPSLVADWGLDYFAAEARHARRALERLDETGGETGDKAGRAPE